MIGRKSCYLVCLILYKNYIFISFITIILLLCMSCDSGYLVKYVVEGSAESATITYLDNGNNIEVVEPLPWVKDIFVPSNTLIGVTVKDPINGNIEARIFFIHNGDWQFYKKAEGETELNIKGVINSLL